MAAWEDPDQLVCLPLVRQLSRISGEPFDLGFGSEAASSVGSDTDPRDSAPGPPGGSGDCGGDGAGLYSALLGEAAFAPGGVASSAISSQLPPLHPGCPYDAALHEPEAPAEFGFLPRRQQPRQQPPQPEPHFDFKRQDGHSGVLAAHEVDELDWSLTDAVRTLFAPQEELFRRSYRRPTVADLAEADLRRDWNGEFQAIYDSSVRSFLDLSCRTRRLNQLSEEFVAFSRHVARIIIEELPLPHHERTIARASGVSGLAGGTKFVVGKVFFKYASNEAGIYDSLAEAQKAANNELRAINAVSQQNLNQLHITLTAVFHLRGHCIMAIAAYPLRGHETLVSGSCDAGRTVVDRDPRLRQLMQQLAVKMHLAEHAVTSVDRSTSVSLCTAGDVEAHFVPHNPPQPAATASGSAPPDSSSPTAADCPAPPSPLPSPNSRSNRFRSRPKLSDDLPGRFYLIDLARHLPPTPPQPGTSQHLSHQFRPEFLQHLRRLHQQQIAPCDPPLSIRARSSAESATSPCALPRLLRTQSEFHRPVPSGLAAGDTGNIGFPPLSSDAFSNWGREDHQRHNANCRRAFQFMLAQHIPAFARTFHATMRALLHRAIVRFFDRRAELLQLQSFMAEGAGDGPSEAASQGPPAAVEGSAEAVAATDGVCAEGATAAPQGGLPTPPLLRSRSLQRLEQQLAAWGEGDLSSQQLAELTRAHLPELHRQVFSANGAFLEEFDWVGEIHSQGINVRYIGHLYRCLAETPPQEAPLPPAENREDGLPPSLHRVRGQLLAPAFLQVQARRLARLAVLLEMVARVLKARFRRHCVLLSREFVSEEAYVLSAALLLAGVLAWPPGDPADAIPLDTSASTPTGSLPEWRPGWYWDQVRVDLQTKFLQSHTQVLEADLDALRACLGATPSGHGSVEAGLLELLHTPVVQMLISRIGLRWSVNPPALQVSSALPPLADSWLPDFIRPLWRVVRLHPRGTLCLRMKEKRVNNPDFTDLNQADRSFSRQLNRRWETEAGEMERITKIIDQLYDEPDNQAFPVIEATLKEICGLSAFYPQVGLSLLTTLTNIVSVRFVQQFLFTPDSHHSLSKPDVQQIVSTRLALHHMCKALLRRYPMLQRFVDDSVEMFKRDEHFRHKDATHNMGEFWILLQLSSFSWDDLKEEILGEVFTRGTLWMLRGCPALEYGVHNEAGGQEHAPAADPDGPVDPPCEPSLPSLPPLPPHQPQRRVRQRDIQHQVSLCFRLTKSFELKRTSLSLLLFTVVIMDSVRRHHLDLGSDEPRADVTTTLRRPLEAQVLETAAALDRILRVWDWGAAFDLLRLPRPSAQDLADRLKASIRQSRAVRYHDYDPDQEVSARAYERLLNNSGCRCASGGCSLATASVPSKPAPPSVGGASRPPFFGVGFRRGSSAAAPAAACRAGLAAMVSEPVAPALAAEPSTAPQCVYADPDALLPDIFHQRAPRVLASQRAKVFQMQRRSASHSGGRNPGTPAAGSRRGSGAARPPNPHNRSQTRRQTHRQGTASDAATAQPAAAPPGGPAEADGAEEGWQVVNNRRKKNNWAAASSARGRGSFRRGGRNR